MKPSKTPQTKSKSKLQGQVYFTSVSPLDVAMSIRHLSLMLKSGMPLSDALDVLKGQSTDPRLKGAYEDLSEKVHQGVALAEAMKEHPKVFVTIVRSIVDVGEQGGTLESNLVFLSDFLKQSYELQRKVKGAMTYPLIVLGLTIAEMFGVIFYILPKLDSLFSTFENIPAFTRAMLDMSHFIRGNVIEISIGAVIFILLWNLFFRTKIGIRTSQYLAINFPIIKGLNRKHILTNFTRTLGILLESGIPIVKAIEITSNTVGNCFYQETLVKVHDMVREGNNLASALEKFPNYFPSTLVRMIAIGEETGTLEENLLYLHDFYAGEVKEMADNLTTLLEPILLIFIGCMIALLALSVISPIYQLTGSINSQK